MYIISTKTQIQNVEIQMHIEYTKSLTLDKILNLLRLSNDCKFIEYSYHIQTTIKVSFQTIFFGLEDRLGYVTLKNILL